MAADYYVFLKAHTIVAGTKDEIKIYDVGGAKDNTYTLDAGTYFLRDLMGEIDSKITWGGFDTAALAFDVDAANPCATFSLEFNSNAQLKADATDNIDLEILGYDSTAAPIDDDGANDIDSTLTPNLVWVAPEPPSADDLNASARTVQTRTVGGQVRTSDQGGPYDDRALAFIMLDKERVLTVDNSADTAATFQTFWEGIRGGTRFEVHKVAISSGTVLGALSSSTLVGTYVLGADSGSSFRPQRHSPGVALYSFNLTLMEYVA